ncbi:MAG: branched-chain amino acid ABC transporter permease [Pseudomonadota bacterium]
MTDIADSQPVKNAGKTEGRVPWIARLDLAAPLVLLILFALVPAYAAAADDGFILSFVTRIMILAIAAISLDLILGYGALVSFGHAAFMGLGAYVMGIAASHGMTELWLVLPLVLGISALFAAVTGAISLRTKGVYFIMITLAFGQMTFFTATSLSGYGGDDGMTLWDTTTMFGVEIFGNDTVFYLVVLAVLVGVYLLCRALVASRFGRVIRGTMENRERMAALGFDVFRFQLVAYIIAGMIAGLSGFLLANHTEFVSPAYMSWQRSGELIIMVVLGGMGTLWGAVIGAIAFLTLEEVLSYVTRHWKMIFGPLIILVALYAQGGIAGFLKGRGRG